MLGNRWQIVQKLDDCGGVENDRHAERIDFYTVARTGSSDLLSLDHVVQRMWTIFHQNEGRIHPIAPVLQQFDARCTLGLLCLLIAFDKSLVHADLGTGFLHFLTFVLDAALLLAQLLLVLVDLSFPIVDFCGFSTFEDEWIILIALIIAHS